MKSVVTGYGFIGKHLVDALLKEGHEVQILEKRDVPTPCETVRTDIRYLDRKIECDYVFHLAGIVNYPYNEANPMECVEANISSTVNALRQLRPSRKFVFASSAAVYARCAQPIPEGYELFPGSMYGASKLAGEILVKQQATLRDMTYLIPRFFNVYGPGQTQGFIVPQLFAQARKGLISLRNLNTYRDYICVEDVVGCIIKMLDIPDDLTVNVGTGKNISTGELAETIAAFFPGCQVKSDERYDDFSPRTLCADISLARSLGWVPRVSMTEGLRKMVHEEPIPVL